MYRYEMEWWNDGTKKFEKGIVAGKSYGSAANRISKFYGIQNVISLRLHELNDILFDEDLQGIIDTTTRGQV